MKVLGIDEAGRGSVIGPLVIAGVHIEESKLKIFERMGVKDSKKISPAKRKVLARKIKKMAEYSTVHITAKDIDNLRAKEINLNEIEKIAMLKIINEIKPKKLIVDAVDVNAKRFELELKEILKDVDIKAEHGADDNYLPVSAASIVAKVERDEVIAEIKKEYRKTGDLGSGYPSDKKTIEFLKNFTYDEMPYFVRKSWKTVENFKNDITIK